MQAQRCGWLFSFVILEVATFGFSQEILNGPSGATIFPDQWAEFTCETRGDISTWTLNGTLLQNLPTDIESDLSLTGTNTINGSRVESLTIPARAEYNGTRVQCLAVSLTGSSAESGNATLKIQGVLSSPSDLMVIYNTSSVTISWTAPFSLDVTGVDPDIWYSVLIYNVSDENNPTAILCTDCVNITETHYTFTPDYLSPCHVYLFSVIPVNGAGQGESSSNITTCAEYASTVSDPCIRPISSTQYRATFSGYEGSNCSYKVSLETPDDSCIMQSASPDELSVTFDLCSDMEYSFEANTCSDIGEEATRPIAFTTYDVQNAFAFASNENQLNVTVDFIENATATGYFVVLESTSGPPDAFIAVATPDDTTRNVTVIDGIPASTYTMIVYDLEEDGLPNRSPAYEQSDSITVHGAGVTPVLTSRFLKNVSIQIEDSNLVKIGCEFKENIAGASCVLIYRKYGNDTLLVIEYPQNTVFPVNLTLNGTNVLYTFALFGKSGSDMDERSFVTKGIPAEEDDSSSSLLTLYFIIGVAVGVGGTGIVVASILFCCCIFIIRHKTHSSSTLPTPEKGESTEMSSSSKIPTPENNNQVTKMSNCNIPTPERDNNQGTEMSNCNIQQPGNSDEHKS